MIRATIEIYISGHTWVAHRDDDHDCTGDTDPAEQHGMADTEVGALRKLIKLEQKEQS